MKKVIKFVKSKRHSASSSTSQNVSSDNFSVHQHSEPVVTNNPILNDYASFDKTMCSDETDCKPSNTSPSVNDAHAECAFTSKSTDRLHFPTNSSSLHLQRRNSGKTPNDNLLRAHPDSDVLSILSSEKEDISLISCSPQSAKIPPPCKPLRSLEYLHSDIFGKNDPPESKSDLVVLGTVRSRHISFSETNEPSSSSVNRLSYPGESSKRRESQTFKELPASFNETCEKLISNDKQSTSASESDWGSDKSLPLSNHTSHSSNSNKSSLTRKTRPRSEIFETNIISGTSSLRKTNTTGHFKRYSLDYNIQPNLCTSESPQLALKQTFAYKYNPPIHENISQIDIDDILDDNRRINDQLETYDDALKHLEQCDLNRVHHKSFSLPRTEIALSSDDVQKVSLSLPRSLTCDDAFKDIKTMYSQSHRSLWRRDKVSQQSDVLTKKHFLQRFKHILDDKWKKRRFGRITSKLNLSYAGSDSSGKSDQSNAGGFTKTGSDDPIKSGTTVLKRLAAKIRAEENSSKEDLSVENISEICNGVESIKEERTLMTAMGREVDALIRSPKNTHTLLAQRLHSKSKEQLDLEERVTLEVHRAEGLARDLAEAKETLNGRDTLVEILQSQLESLQAICCARTDELNQTRCHQKETLHQVSCLRKLCEQYQDEIEIKKTNALKATERSIEKETDLKGEIEKWRKQCEEVKEKIEVMVTEQLLKNINHATSETQTDINYLKETANAAAALGTSLNIFYKDSTDILRNDAPECIENKLRLEENEKMLPHLEITVKGTTLESYLMVLNENEAAIHALAQLKQTMQECSSDVRVFSSDVVNNGTCEELLRLRKENEEIKLAAACISKPLVCNAEVGSDEPMDEIACLPSHAVILAENTALKLRFEKLIAEQEKREIEFECIVKHLKSIDEETLQYRGKIETLVATNLTLNEHLKQVYVEKNQLLEQIAVLSGESKVLRNEIEDQCRRIKQSLDEADDFRRKYRQLSEENETNTLTICKQNQTILTSQEDIKELNAKIQTLLQEFNEVKIRESITKRDYDSLVENLKGDLDRKCRELTNLNNENDMLIKQFNNELEQVHNEKSTLKKEVDENTSERDLLRKEINDLYIKLKETVSGAESAPCNSARKDLHQLLVNLQNENYELKFALVHMRRSLKASSGTQTDTSHDMNHTGSGGGKAPKSANADKIADLETKTPPVWYYTTEPDLFDARKITSSPKHTAHQCKPFRQKCRTFDSTDLKIRLKHYHKSDFRINADDTRPATLQPARNSLPDVSTSSLNRTCAHKVSPETITLFHTSKPYDAERSCNYEPHIDKCLHLQRTRSKSLSDINNIAGESKSKNRSHQSDTYKNAALGGSSSMPSIIKTSSSSSYSSCFSPPAHWRADIGLNEGAQIRMQPSQTKWDVVDLMRMEIGPITCSAETFKGMIQSFQFQLDQLQGRVKEETDRHCGLSQKLRSLEGKIEAREKFNEEVQNYNIDRDQKEIRGIERRVRQQFMESKQRLHADLATVQATLQDKYTMERELRMRCEELEKTVQTTESALRKQMIENVSLLPSTSSSRNVSVEANICAVPRESEPKKNNKSVSDHYRHKLDETIRENLAAADLSHKKDDNDAYIEELNSILKYNLYN